jgi:hypothetical protein
MEFSLVNKVSGKHAPKFRISFSPEDEKRMFF